MGNSLPRGDETVLLVDDDEQVRRALGLLLDNLGYQAHLAEDGSSALEVLREHPDIQLMISDIVMPGLDGLQLVEKARSLHPDLDVLLISGYTDHRVPPSKRTRFMRKPFSMQDLAQEVRYALNPEDDPEASWDEALSS